MTDTMTGGEMITALEEDGCRVQCEKVSGDYGMVEWHVRVSWPHDGGTYRIERRTYTNDPIGDIYPEVTTIREMQRAGYTVLMDQLPDHRFRVRVKHFVNPRTRSRYHGMPVYDYNVATTSTSGYPVCNAYEKWQQHMQQGGKG